MHSKALLVPKSCFLSSLCPLLAPPDGFGSIVLSQYYILMVLNPWFSTVLGVEQPFHKRYPVYQLFSL